MKRVTTFTGTRAYLNATVARLDGVILLERTAHVEQGLSRDGEVIYTALITWPRESDPLELEATA